ncbi:SDR family NAD(P)-dependent oxidoreductase [Oscillatoria sp. CS-180]|uniref:type I polyketide synthase n=1 Tax=Oscillatoria sp. CS-180 TaxID=3021720 RepID=UPI00232C143A|nr:type I polyketide synthase [Oscillatoria sp. CS-180]MDB9527376.1 SDR family NAD(P)-dependent oxidoreductase [Oscillatoria sp. CS-180]
MQSRDRTSNPHPNSYRDLLREATLQIRSLRSELEAVRQQQNEPIAIVGMACRFPGGANTLEAYWDLLRHGCDAITAIPDQRWNVAALYDPDADAPGKMYTRYGGFIDDVDQFDPQFFGISPREARSLDPQQRLLLEVSYTALENAGQPPFDLRGTRTGVFVGVSFDDYAQLSVRSGDLTRIDAHSSLGNTRSIAAGRLAYTFGFHGPTMQLDTTCSSSLLAVHLACQSLRSGESNLALAGGVNLMLSPEPTIGFCKLKALAPDGRCKTFDAAADGYGRGEGCGIVVLKRLSDAIDNQDPILALVRGSAVNHDGASNGLTAPNGAAQEAVLQQALENAGVYPQQVQYVEVHGTGTRLGDPIEVLALDKVMGQRPTPLLIGSVKTNIGHLESAAGVAGLIKVILSLQHQHIPPHLHLQSPNPYIPWDQLAVSVPTQLTPWPTTAEAKRAGLSSFGMSGTNLHLILEEAPQDDFKLPDLTFRAAELRDSQRPLHLLALSARSDEALRQLVQRYRDWLNSGVEAELPNIAFSANVGRSHFNHRCALIAADLPHLRQQLDNLLDTPPAPTSLTQGALHHKIAFLFTGQGSQYPNMGRELYDTEPVFQQALDRCADLLTAEGIDLLDALYGSETQNSDSPNPQPPTPLHQTAYTQPALFALEYALAQLWLAWGIEPDGVMGHSLGEYVAACLAGVFSLEDGLRLVATRGRLMQALPVGGGMVAVKAARDRLSPILPPDISIAAINGPEATVISGEQSALASVTATLTEQGIKTQPLPVSHAFHSALMEPMMADFKEVASTVSYRPPQLELVSNITGQITSTEIASADYWVQHVRQSVQFAAGMETLAAEDYNTFIEIGPKPVLSVMGQACLPEVDTLWLPSLRPDADWQTLLTSLGKLYMLGATIDWAGFDRAYPRRIVQVPNYPFQRQRYWVETDLPGKASGLASLPEPSLTSPSHPLLGSPLPLAGETVRYFQSQVSQDTPVYLKEHQIFGAVVMPAAGYLEIAIAAAHSLPYPSLTLCDVSFPKALVLSKLETVLIQTVLTPRSTEQFKFEIFSQTASSASTWQCNATGEIESTSPVLTAFSITAKQEELTNEISLDVFYSLYQAWGICYGPEFRVLQRIWRRPGEALAQVCLSNRQQADSEHYHVHPILLDAGLQLAGATLDWHGITTTYLPISIQRLSWPNPANRSVQWVYAQQRPTAMPEDRQFNPVIDINLLAADGTIIAAIEGLQLQPVSPELLGDSQQSNESDTTWLYQVAWQPQPLSAQPLDFLQAPEAIRDRIAPDFTQLVSQPKFVAYQSLLPQLEALSLHYITQALEKLGWSPQLSQTVTHPDIAQQLQIAPQHERFFQYLLAKVDGIEQKPEDTPSKIHNPQSAIANAELTLITRCGENLAAVLTGDLDPLTLLFPDGNLSDLTQLYESSPGAQVMNTLVQKAVSAAIAAAQRPIRILEIGAGTGGTTAHLLPHLHGVEYVFTDVSPLFLSQAKERFQAYPFMRYDLLDIERSPIEQGFQQPFDLVIAANVLHATADLRQTLGHVRQLLAPGGELILLEGTESLTWLDLIFGLTEGWWKFADRDLRPRHPLLSAAQWQSLLQESGFTPAILQPDTSPKSDEVTAAPSLPQAVVVGQRREEVELSSAPADWLILCDCWEMGKSLADGLQLKGQSPLLVTFAPSNSLEDQLALNWSTSDLEAQLLQILQMKSHWQGVIYLTGPATNSDALAEASKEACRHGLHLVQALLEANLSSVPRLYFVTQEATPLSITETGLARSPLWGLAKTVALEHPELRCSCIDLDSTDTTAVDSLTAELLADSPEQNVSLQAHQRRVARLQPYTPVQVTPYDSVRLTLSEPGTLANLTFLPVERRSPAADEVEIRVATAGLNFRDVLTALGQYPGEPVLGCECVGEIVAAGEAVQDLGVGQPVMAIASNSFGQYVTVHRAMVIPVPAALSPEAAATIPVTFLTAYYSLVQLAQIKASDRILIHAAAGGVGQAAIQIAQSVGAEIIATASPSKWETLRSLGITHILNSRTLDFADEVMALTQGEGVDVVLNSLAGEFRDKSIQVLCQSGRFIELGLGDLPPPPDSSYFPINLVALCQEQPDLIQSLLQTLHQQFASGLLHPLPYTTFRLSEATQAFRTMQQAQHIGKIILTTGATDSGEPASFAAEQRTNNEQHKTLPARSITHNTEQPALSIHADATYLITGGTGGLGLQVADWMIAQGARHLLLISRHEPTAAVQAQIQVWSTQGAIIETAAVDVSNSEALVALLQRIAESPYPLQGVVHGAGVLSDGRLEQLSWDAFERVLAPKVEGAWNLHQLTQDLPLDFFILFSSAASLLGSPGQANHAAANAFLDGLAHYRRSQGLPGLSLNWGAWSTVGSALKYQRGNGLAGLHGIELIAPEQGLQQLAQIWSQSLPQIGIVPINWPTFLHQGHLRQSSFLEAFWQAAFHQTKSSHTRSQKPQREAFRQQLAAAPKDQQQHLLDTHVCNQISQVLGFAPEELDRQQGFFDLGLDSLTAMELKNSLQASLDCSLPATLAFDYPTVDRLLAYLTEQLLAEPLSPKTERVPDVTHADPEDSVEDLPSEADLEAQLDQKLADLEDLLN